MPLQTGVGAMVCAREGEGIMRKWNVLLLLLALLAALAGCGGEAPAEEEDTAPQDTLQPAVKSEAGLEASQVERAARPLTEEEILDAYDRAVRAFSWFDLETLPYSQDAQVVDGWTYQRVDYQGMENLADLRAYLRGLFSEELTDQLLATGGARPIYRDVDGALYEFPSSRDRDADKGSVEIQVEQTDEATCWVNVTVELLDQEEIGKLPALASSWQPKPWAAENGGVFPAVLHVLKGLDILDPAWQTLLDRAEKAAPIPVPDDLLERTAAYFIFRYPLKAVNDGDLLGRAAFCVLAVLTVERAAAVCGLPEALRQFRCSPVRH